MRLPASPSSRRLAGFLVVVFAVGACNEESTAPRVASVEVSPGSATLQELGATQQFSARSLDMNGEPVTGTPVTWSSDDEGVATVSSTGVATAMGTGVATVTATATASGVSGSATLTVLAPEPECVDPPMVSLAVGEHAVFGSQECFVLPPGAQGDLYRVVVTRPDSATASDVVTATLSVTALGPAATTQAPSSIAPTSPSDPVSHRLTAGALAELEYSLRLSASTERFHARLRASEEALLDRLGPEIATASAPSRAPVALQAASQKIRVDPSTTCAEPDDEVTGILVHESAEVAIYQDSTQRISTPVSLDQARRMAEYYADYGKEVVERYFGVPTDVDGNGRVLVFASPVVDAQTAAFVWSGDFFDQESCSASNEAEIIFFNTDLIRRMDEEDNFQALETLVHEMKHVVSLHNRLRASINAGSSRFQPPWVEEGTAEIAGNMSSRVAMAAVGGVPVGQRLTVEDLANADGKLERTPENYGVLLRMLRTVRYLSSQPNGVMVRPAGAPQDHSVYGTGWKFHRWLGDAYGNARVAFADSALFRQLSDSTVGPGREGLLAITGRSFKELFQEYALAVARHETGAPEGMRRITSYDFVSATDILCRPGSGDGCPNNVAPQPDGLYPWPVTEQSGEPGTSAPAPFATADFSGPLGPVGLRFHDFRSGGIISGGLEVDLNMAAPGAMLVVRLR